MKQILTQFKRIPVADKNTGKPTRQYNRMIKLIEQCILGGGYVEFDQHGPYREVYPAVVSATLHWEAPNEA
jgi:hypothetical protein